MKKIIFLMSLFYLLFLGSANASGNIKVYLYDELVDMDNPIIVNGNTLVPLRVLFESLGSTVTWDGQSKTVHAKKGNTELSIQIGNVNVTNNGSTITLEEPAQIIDNKTYVPLRFVAESFNQDVNWDKDNNAIHIGKSLTAKDISKIAAPAVVYIEVNAYDGKIYSGSGFIVDKSGVVVTNYHVIDNAKSAIIKLIDGRAFNVSNVINYDADRDIAILKLNGSDSLPTVTLGDSDKNLNGDKVYAIGSPLGYQNSITDGLISNTSRNSGGFQFIQTSAPISHGNSGGPLINYKGEVVGINTLTSIEGQNINFSIPINDYKKMHKDNLNASFEQIYNNQHVIFYNDATYVGDKKNNLPNGIGIMKWNNGDQYIGTFVDGKPSGKGKITWANNSSYDGEWSNGVKQGYGKHTDEYGNVCECQFSNNTATGKGILHFKNGDVYVGDLVNGTFTGYGTYTYANGQVNQGYWANGTYLSSSTSTGSTPPSSSSTTPVTTKSLSLYSYDGKTYLGKLTSNEFELDSIFNAYGTYGNKYGLNSIWNEYGIYGSKYSTTSAFNELALNPPLIIDENGSTVGRLTINSTIIGAVSPVGLKEALKKLGY